MKSTIKRAVRPYVPHIILSHLREQQNSKDLKNWERNGCPVPPPHIVKQNAIAEYQKKYGYSVMIETGTYYGDMVEAQKKRFQKIISIELSVELSQKAQKRFLKDKNITIVQGDSGKILAKILENVDEPAIFWLDGHYSSGVTAKGNKECPIFEELDGIFSSKPFEHILLIDDARCFTGKGDYPTIEELTEYVKNKNGKYNLEVRNDIIRFVI